MNTRIKSLLLVICIILGCCNIPMRVHAKRSSEDSEQYSTTESQNNYYIKRKKSFGFNEENNILGMQIGAIDAKKPVPDKDLSRMPFKCIGRLIVKVRNKNTKLVNEVFGTAFLVGEKTILTSGHLLYRKDATYISATFYPQKRVGNTPYAIQCETLHIPPEYIAAVDIDDFENTRKYDYGLVELKTKIGAQLGYLELGGYNTSIDDKFIEGKRCVIIGYPGMGDQLYRQKGPIIEAKKGLYLTYAMDTFGGHSGSPIIYPASNGKYYVVGIHDSIDPPAGTRNSARYITKRIYDLVNKYK